MKGPARRRQHGVPQGRDLRGLRGERLTSFGRPLSNRKARNKGISPEDFPGGSFAFVRAYARLRELYYPRGQSGTLRGHCAKRGTVFQVSNGIFVLRIHVRRVGSREYSRDAALLGFEHLLLGISNHY